MTISTTTSTVTYQGNGATTSFTFPFVAGDASDLIISYTDSNGITSVLSPTTYTIILNAVPLGGLWSIGGSVTYPIGSGSTPILVDTFLSITRDVPYEQTISIGNQGAFYPQAVEQGLDLLELQIQQLETVQAYTLRAPVTDPNPLNELPSAELRANGVLEFDANGQPIIGQIATVIPEPGQFAVPRKVTVSTTATVNILASDSFGGVSIYQGGSAVTTLQLPVGFGPFPIFDASFNCSTFPITILPPSGLTFQGGTTSYKLVFNGQSITCYNDGTTILIG